MTAGEQMLKANTKQALDKAKERVEDRDKDFVMLVTGSEGNGKSSLAMLMADYWDENFDPGKQICMDYEDFIRTADDLDNFQSIVFDEGIDALLSRNHSKKKNKIMLEWFREARAKNLFIVICMPSWLEIDKPIRDERAHALVRVVKQGWCHFFSKTKMDEIEVDRRGNKKTVDFPDPVFRDYWDDPSGSAVWQRYQAMKEENVSNLAEKYLDSDGGGDDSNSKKFRRLRMKVAKTMIKQLGITQTETAKQLGCTQAAIAKWKSRGTWANIPPLDVSKSDYVDLPDKE